MVLNPHQFTAHVKGPHDFPDTQDKPLVWGPNTGEEEGKHAISSEFVDMSEHQLNTVFHEPGWDLLYKPDPSHVEEGKEGFLSRHKFERPEHAPYGHGVSGMHYPNS